MITIALVALADDPTISVSAQQRYPWNGLVDLYFTITGTSGTKYDTSFTAKDMVGNTNIAMRTIRKSDGAAAATTEQLLPGTYSWTWDAAADLPKDWKSDRVTVTGTTAEHKLLYMVIDLSAGANATSYPISYLNDVPSGGWGNAYKTTKLVLRRIEAGSFKMQGTYNVTLTKPFFCGVFEVTQKQYTLVLGGDPPAASTPHYGDKRPVEYVAYSHIRSDGGFVKRIQTRTGLSFDLPTEAQWEYACRAGTTSSYNNGGSTVNDLKTLGRYSGNTSDGKGGYSQHTTVGSYQPNAWGLYDMHGNMFEWCRDYYGDLSNNVTDPTGATWGNRVIRGGSWRSSAPSGCTSSYREGQPANYVGDNVGFRISLTISN